MVIVPEPWFKVLIFLVGCPLVVLLAFFWFVVKCLYNYLRDLGLKSAVAAVYQNGYKKRHPSGPATMYTPDPHPWDPDYLQQLDPRFQLDPPRYPPELSVTSRAGRSSSHLSSRKPTQVLPDGTIVVPIGSEDESDMGSDDVIEDAVDSDRDDLNSNKYGSVRTLSDKYQKPVDAIDDGLVNYVTSKPAFSEDRSSIISLSDKYRITEEVEVFHEHYQKPPPEPVRPSLPPKKSNSSASSQVTESSKT